jgi:glycosyltransferase involved in cell wall biosynthesis
MKVQLTSIVIPTFRHGEQLRDVLYSLTVAQEGVSKDEYEIIVINDEPEDMIVFDAAKAIFDDGYNIRYIRNPVEEQHGIKNAGRSGNIGARMYAKGDLLILMVDSARIVTPRALRRSIDTFNDIGPDVCTTVLPYHIGKYYFDKSFTVEDCRNLMNKIEWWKDPYKLKNYCADTYISRTGRINESTFHGITKENFLKVGGWNEAFTGWGLHNIDLWRRCVYPLPPKGSSQEEGVAGKWGKIGLGLKPVNLEGEATYHINHELTVPRVLPNIKKDTAFIWKEYKRLNECIVANIEKPNWGLAPTSEEVDLK